MSQLIVLVAMCTYDPVIQAHAAKSNSEQESSLTPPSSIDPDSLTISVMRSTNAPLDFRAAFYPFPFKPSDPAAQTLRAEIGSRCSLEGLSEVDAFDKATTWVHSQFDHDPVNSIADRKGTLEILQRASQGEKFTCVEYARVLTDLLISYGYYARIVGLSRRNIGNPKTGARHVGVEVWSCVNHKWIFLDPQFGVRIERSNVGLSAREMQVALITNDPLLTVLPVNKTVLAEPEVYDSLKTQYVRFIAGHTAFVDVPYIVNGKVGLLMFVPEDRLEPLLFQGMPLSNIEYTKDASHLYASLGSIHLDLQYDYASNQPNEPLKKPAYTITASASCPWARGFECRIDKSGWKRLASNTVHWDIHAGSNEVQIRALCSSGCYTQACVIEVFYGSRADARKLRQRNNEKGEPTH